MNIHCLQHVASEGPGKIADWAAAKGHRMSFTRLYQGEQTPEIEAVDWVVVMGGPMNVYEYRSHPWLRPEKRFLELAIGRGKGVLGVCLGSQLLADILGAKVYQNAEKEIGWLPVRVKSNPEAGRLLGQAGSEIVVFHWHGDTFDLPGDAVHLAESAGCVQQAFVYGDRLVGLQFHLEVAPAGIQSLLSESAGDLTPGRFVQSPEQILRSQPHEAIAQQTLWRLLDQLEAAIRPEAGRV